MVQLRFMDTTNADDVHEVLGIVLSLLAGDPRVVVSNPQDLGVRGPTGARVTLEVIPAHRSGTATRVHAERVDEAARPPALRRTATGQRALPPGRRGG